MDSRFSSLRRSNALVALVMLAGVIFMAAGGAWAKELSATAALSSAKVSVGESVELDVTVTGARQTEKPPQLTVEGLLIQYTGASSRIEMNNFDVTSSVTHTYTVVPQRAGTFTIPAIQIQAGKLLSTKPLTLTVSNEPAQPQRQGGWAGRQPQSPKARTQPGTRGGGNAPGQPDADAADDSEAPLAHAEWVIHKTTAYVGESIPAELRVYLASNVAWTLQQLPTVAGDGLTIQTLPHKPGKSSVTRDGHPYDLVIFKTAITAAKTGKLVLAPTEVSAVARVPQRRSARPRVPNGFPDLFDDPFFGNAFMTEQEVPIKTEAVTFDIKPLPAAGKPRSFSGAVGEFTLETKAAPLHLHAGDPVTVTAAVSGIGSFDRMGPPTVAEEPGWRAYPPSSKFQANDEVGVSGTKTFDIALIPDRPQTALPKIEFSYFDPAKEQYVTLTGSAIPLTVEGTAASATPPPSAATAQAKASPATAAPETPSKPNDILFIRTDPGQWGASFEPVWRTRAFWWSQLVPLAALLALGGWQWQHARSSNLQARRLAILRQKKAEAAKLLRQPGLPPGRFYDAVVRSLQVDAALAQAQERPNKLPQGLTAHDPETPETLDAEAVCAARNLDTATAAQVRSLFSAHDELRYAGAGAEETEAAPVSPERREAVLRILNEIEKNQNQSHA